MLRRLTLMAVALLCLSVIAPAALACESDDGCCPDQTAPCEQVAAEVVACSAGQPIQAVVRVAVHELAALDLQLSKGVAPVAVALPRRPDSTFASFVHPTPRLPDQRQLYLHTGRLRL